MIQGATMKGIVTGDDLVTLRRAAVRVILACELEHGLVRFCATVAMSAWGRPWGGFTGRTRRPSKKSGSQCAQ